jgi:hypothetical protein
MRERGMRAVKICIIAGVVERICEVEIGLIVHNILNWSSERDGKANGYCDKESKDSQVCGAGTSGLALQPKFPGGQEGDKPCHDAGSSRQIRASDAKPIDDPDYDQEYPNDLTEMHIGPLHYVRKANIRRSEITRSIAQQETDMWCSNSRTLTYFRRLTCSSKKARRC